MPFPAKTTQVIGFLIKAESEYATLNAPSASTDGLLPHIDSDNPAPIFTEAYEYDGMIGPSPGSFIDLPDQTPSARVASGPPKFLLRPADANYSGSVVHSLHEFLKICGFTMAFGSNKWVATPTAPSAAAGSATLYAYGRGELWPVRGALSDFGWEAANLGPVIFDCGAGIKGLLNDITDISLPAITYVNGLKQPLMAQGATLSINGVTTLNMLSSSFKMNRSIGSPRHIQTASGGHLGYVPGRRKPELKVVVEAVAISGFDPYALFKNRTSFAVTLNYGAVGTHGRHMRFITGQAQLKVPPVLGQNNDVATWELTIKPNPTTPTSNDDFTLEFETTGA